MNANVTISQRLLGTKRGVSLIARDRTYRGRTTTTYWTQVDGQDPINWVHHGTAVTAYRDLTK